MFDFTRTSDGNTSPGMGLFDTVRGERWGTMLRSVNIRKWRYSREENCHFMPQEISYDHQHKTVTTKMKSETPYCDVRCYSFTNTMGDWGEGVRDAEVVALKRKCTHTVTVLERLLPYVRLDTKFLL